MITACDTNILLDLLTEDKIHFSSSYRLLNIALNKGRVIISPIVLAELRPFFEDDTQLLTSLSESGIECTVLDSSAALLAGSLWQQYKKHKGSKNRILADFLIGAHAHIQAKQFLTRDRDFYKTYFKGLHLLHD